MSKDSFCYLETGAVIYLEPDLNLEGLWVLNVLVGLQIGLVGLQKRKRCDLESDYEPESSQRQKHRSGSK